MMLVLVLLGTLAAVVLTYVFLTAVLNLLKWAWLGFKWLFKWLVVRPVRWSLLTFFAWMTDRSIQNKREEERQSFMIDNGIIEGPNTWQ